MTLPTRSNKATYERRSSSAAFEERWFTEDDNTFSTTDVSSILKSDSNITTDYSLTSELKLNQSNDITSLTYSHSKDK